MSKSQRVAIRTSPVYRISGSTIWARVKLRPMCQLNLDKIMDVQDQHVTNRTLSEVLASLNKGLPPPACFDWRGWFRAGLPFFWGDLTLRLHGVFLLIGILYQSLKQGGALASSELFHLLGYPLLSDRPRYS
ncbi:hypothetical protein J6590_067406 [Homalodisca vitripennis]|nr:hypothetical protein J6590_067406 [Homalodisca vitripennis]